MFVAALRDMSRSSSKGFENPSIVRRFGDRGNRSVEV